jgi:hypothetical protein
MPAALFSRAEENFSALDPSKSAAWRHHREDCMARTGDRRLAFVWLDANRRLFPFVEAAA